jgi:adenylate cyclase
MPLSRYAPLLIPVAGSVLALLLWQGGIFGGYETVLEDRLFQAKPIDPSIVIVAIDSDSLMAIGQWPWTRATFAQFFDALRNAPPKVVGLDVMLAEPSRIAGDDSHLTRTLATLPYPLIMPLEASGLEVTSIPPKASGSLVPLATFTSSPRVSEGAVNLILDTDAVVRRFPASVSFPEGLVPAFSLETVLKSGALIPRSPSAIERIVYAAPSGAIRRIPFTRAIAEPSLLANKIVFVGATAPDLHDEQATPVDKGTHMPGVEIQAQIANMLLQGYAVVPAPPIVSFLWILVMGLLPGLFFFLYKRRSLFALLASAASGLVSVALVVTLFMRGIVIPLIHTSIAAVVSAGLLFAYHYLLARRDVREMRGVFGKYVSKEVLEHILKNPTEVVLGGEERTVTVLFSDIRGFTTLSEATSPNELVAVLNRYFTLMTDEVFKHQGVLDKYIGDAIMAFWGAPISDPHHADHALAAAQGMILRLAEFNAELVREGRPTIDIGVGLYTGPVVVGNIGAESRFDYTVIGDTVNTASRLEGLNKEYKTHIIIGETTKNELTGAYPLSHLGGVRVKGKEQSVEIYSVVE